MQGYLRLFSTCYLPLVVHTFLILTLFFGAEVVLSDGSVQKRPREQDQQSG